MKNTFKAMVPICLALLTACGGDDDGDDGAAVDASEPVADAAPTPLTLDDLCDATDGVFPDFFEAAFECFPEFALLLGEFPEAAELQVACESSFGDYIDDGSIELGNSADMAACLAELANIDCEVFEFDVPNACSALLSGTVAEDDDCDTSDQCAGDSFCDSSGGGDCGVCAPRKANNENCFENEECSSRLCSGADEVNPGLCRDFGLVGDSCAIDDDCSGRLVCNDNTSLCQSPQQWAVGDTCASNENGDCGFPFSDLLCDEDAGECEAYLMLGAPCSNLFQCDFRNYETCQLSQGSLECVAPDIQLLGQDCSIFLGQKCEPGLVCSEPFDGGQCENPAAAGDVCVEGNDDCGGLLLNCVAGECQYGQYTGMCPAPE